jgi:hypothetical protein
MKKIILGCIASMYMALSIMPVFAVDRFNDTLVDNTQSIKNNVDTSFQTQNGIQWASGVRDFLIYIVKKIITPIVIFVWILMGIVWLYELLGSTKDDGAKKWFNYILRGALWIIIIISANFLADTLVNWWIFVYDAQNQFLWGITAQRIYQRLMFPFLKFFMYIAIGILFILALIRTMTMLFDPKDDSAKQARTIIVWNAIGILVIIFAKNIIETIFGLEQKVVDANATSLWQLGSWVLADKQVPYIYTIINYVISFVWFFILVMIIVQAIQLLTNPTDEAVQKKMRTNFIYIFIWLIIIATSYVITNVLIAK